MQKYKSNITTTSGAAVRGVPVHVLDESGNPAALFLDRAGTVTAANPLTTSADGTFYFYATNGRYSLRTTVEGASITDADVVLLMDPEEITVAGPIAEATQRAEAAAQRAEAAIEDSGIPEMVSAAQEAIADANLAVQQAGATAGAVEVARQEVVAVATEFGDVAGAISAANSAKISAQASAGQASASEISSQAAKAGAEGAKVLAELARDSANSAGNNFPTIAEGITATNATVNKFFAVPLVGGVDLYVLYRNVSGTAVEQGRGPSTKILQQFVGYTGEGPIFPIATDQNNRLLLGFDVGKQSLTGVGLVTAGMLRNEIDSTLDLYSEQAYVGAGPVWPFIIDKNRKVLLGYDESTQTLVGPGISSVGPTVTQRSADIPLGELSPVAKAVNHLCLYGQSLSGGHASVPPLSISQPYSNISFSAGPNSETTEFTSFSTLIENTHPRVGMPSSGETPCSGAANYATTLAAVENGIEPASHVILATSAGRGSYRISQLDKASAWYEEMLMAQVRAAHAVNNDYAMHAIFWVQGESDAMAGTLMPYATYRQKLEKFQVDIEADVRVVSGQTSPVFLITYQMSYAIKTWPDIAKAQLDLVQKNKKFAFATPCYHLPFRPDNIHLTNVGSKWLGAYGGRAYKQLVHDKIRPKWLNPISATIRGAVIHVRFDVPTLPLQLDTTTLAATTDMGFKVLDGSAAAPIGSMRVSGSDVVITLVSAPVGAVKVRYAMDYLGSGLTITGGASGNLHDSTPDTCLIDGIERPLYHVSPHFELTATRLGE